MNHFLLRIRFEVLRGTLYEENPLSALRGNALIWREIFDIVDDDYYTRHINTGDVAYSSRGWIQFPKPKDININMMPFKIFDYPYQIPPECEGYFPLIGRCRRYLIEKDETLDRIAYLTIQESAVPVGEAQRRPGLHVERPGAIVAGSGGRVVRPGEPYYRELLWGTGRWGPEGVPTDGIFMASSVDKSCMVWPVLIESPAEVSDQHGGIERMRKYLGKGETLAANELCWITDRTPHESMPLQPPADAPGAAVVYRQFFRLVVGPISVWYSRHNTPNPFGIAPAAEISDADKFAEAA